VGPAGLAVDVVRQLCHDMRVTIVDDDSPSPPEADVVLLVVPETEHWEAARAQGLPIVVMLSEEVDDPGTVDAILAGADAVLHYDTAPDTVLTVLEEVSRGGTVMRPSQMRVVAAMARTAVSAPGVILSRREMEILASIADGDAVKQTARRLGISPKTVENLQGRLFRKLGARNRAQSVARAHAMGLL